MGKILWRSLGLPLWYMFLEIYSKYSLRQSWYLFPPKKWWQVGHFIKIRSCIKLTLESLSMSHNSASSVVGIAEFIVAHFRIIEKRPDGSWNCILVSCKNPVIFDEPQFNNCQLSEVELHTDSIVFPIRCFGGQIAYTISRSHPLMLAHHGEGACRISIPILVGSPRQ